MIGPIPLRTPIVDQNNAINEFFRLRWEEVRNSAGTVPAKGLVSLSGQNAAIVGKLLYTVVNGGLYEVTFSARRTIIDGVGSSLTFSWDWTDGGVPLSVAAPVDSVDSTGELYSGTRLLRVDGDTNLQFDMAYTSTTPGQMHFEMDVTAKQVVQA